jgi:two-component system sensor kinase FixL
VILDSDSSGSSTTQTSRLLEQLMQIARISALEELASGIAHELNQPIGAIATFAQTGERMLNLAVPMVGDARDILHHIGNEALKAGQGIHRIRGLFRGMDSAKSICEIAELITELKPVLQLLAERSKVKLDIDIQRGLPPVSIDRLRIQHVVCALVQNAIEAPGAASTPAVRIDVSGDRYSVVVSVADNGSGIAAAARDQLFRPFFTTKGNGTGLGLASSRAIVEAHEGTIGFEDVNGGGTRFWFRLPATAGVNET